LILKDARFYQKSGLGNIIFRQSAFESQYL